MAGKVPRESIEGEFNQNWMKVNGSYIPTPHDLPLNDLYGTWSIHNPAPENATPDWAGPQNYKKPSGGGGNPYAGKGPQ